MFAQIKLYIYGAIAGLIAILYGWGKYKSNKLDKAEDKIEAFELKDEITAKQDKAVEVILDEEQKEIDSAIMQNKTLSKSERLNKL